MLRYDCWTAQIMHRNKSTTFKPELTKKMRRMKKKEEKILMNVAVRLRYAKIRFFFVSAYTWRGTSAKKLVST